MNQDQYYFRNWFLPDIRKNFNPEEASWTGFLYPDTDQTGMWMGAPGPTGRPSSIQITSRTIQNKRKTME